MGGFLFLAGEPAWNNLLGNLSKILYTFLCAIFKILYYLEMAFYILATGNVNGKTDFNVDENNNLIFNIFGWKNKGGIPNNGIGTMLIVFFAISSLVLVVGILIAIGKRLLAFNKEFKMQEILGKALISIACILCFPLAFYMFLYISTYVINLIFYACGVSFGSNNDDSIASHLFYSFFNKPNGIEMSIEEIFDSQFGCKNGNPWDISYATVNGEYNGIQYINLDIGKGASYHYILSLIVSCVILWALFSCTIGLAERIINCIILYIIGTVPIASMVMDNGDRFKNYRGLALSKMFGIIGNILSMYIFVFMIKLPMLNDIKDNTYNWFDDRMVGLMVYYIVVLGGAMCCAKGSNLIASMISSVAQNEDGWSQAQTQRLLSGGMRLAKGVGMASLGGAIAGAGGVLGNTLGSADGINNAGGGTGNNTKMSAPSPQGGTKGKLSTGGNPVRKAGARVFNAMSNGARRGGVFGAIGAGAAALVTGAFVDGAKGIHKGAKWIGNLAKSTVDKHLPFFKARSDAKKQLKQDNKARKQQIKAQKNEAKQAKYNANAQRAYDKQLDKRLNKQMIGKYSRAFKGMKSEASGSYLTKLPAILSYHFKDKGELKKYVDAHKNDTNANGEKLGASGAFFEYHDNKINEKRDRINKQHEENNSSKFDNKGGNN